MKMLKCIHLFASLLFAGSALAAVAPTPVAVWNGNLADGFRYNGVTLSLNGNSVANGVVTINQTKGVQVNFGTAMTAGVTVLFKYSDLPLGVANQAIATSCVASNGTGDRTGVYLGADNKSHGIWGTGTYDTSVTTQGTLTDGQTSGVFAFNYKGGAGTYLYRIADGACSCIYGNPKLMSGSDGSIYGCAIGGPRDTTTFKAMSGLKILAVAIFNKVLSNEEMEAYQFPYFYAQGVIGNWGGNCGYGNDRYGITLPATDVVPAGTKVEVTKLEIADCGGTNADNQPTYIAITVGDKTTMSAAKVSGGTIAAFGNNNPTKLTYTFPAGCVLTVGTPATIKWYKADGVTETETKAGELGIRYGASNNTTGRFLSVNNGSGYAPVALLYGRDPIALTEKTIDADKTWTELWEGSEPEADVGVMLTVSGNPTLTLDENSAFASLTLLGNGNLTIKGATGAQISKVTLDAGFSGSAVFEIDATNGFSADEALKSFIKSAPTTTKFIFNGSGSNGATLDLGDTGNTFATHLVFEGGKHTLKIVNSNHLLSETGSAENPTILVKTGTEVDFTAKDLSGWGDGYNINGVIRVNSGATLNYLQNGNDTCFYRQRLWLDPGSLTTFNYTINGTESRYRWHGGAASGYEQIYVPASDSDQTDNPAILRQVGDGGLHLASDNTRGLGIFVGTNSKLVLDTTITGVENAPLKKFGDGVLDVTGDVSLSTANMFEIVAGKLALGGMVSSLKLDAATEIEVAYGKTATISAISGDYAITKTGAGALNLPVSYTRAITLEGGLLSRELTSTVTINGDIDLGTTEMPLAWTLDAASTGFVKLPVGFPFGQIVKASEIPANLTFKDSEGEAIAVERLEVDGDGYITLKKSEINVPYDVSVPTIVDGDLVFGNGGSINIIHTGASLTATGTITLPANGLPISFVIDKEYVNGTVITLVTAADFLINGGDATITDFKLAPVKFPKGMSGEFNLVDNGGNKSLVFEFTNYATYTQAVDNLLKGGNLLVRLDASRGVVTDDNGKITEWQDVSGNGRNAMSYTNQQINDQPTVVVGGLREYVDFGVTGSKKDLKFEQFGNARTVIQVLDIEDNWSAFLLGGTTVNFHRCYSGTVGAYGHPDGNDRAKYETVRDSGEIVQDWGHTKIPTGYRVISFTTTQACNIDYMTQDRTQGGRDGGRKLSEFMIFDRVLTNDEMAAIEDYLTEKWGLNYYRNEANIEGDIAWSEIQWKGGHYYGDIETTLTITGNTVLTFDTPIGTPDIEFIREFPDYQFEVVIEKESGYVPEMMMIEAGEQLTLRGGTPEDPFVYTGWVMVDEGGMLVIDGGSVECEGFYGEGIVDVRRGEFRLGSIRGAKLRFAESTALLVDANVADDGEVTLMFEAGSASPTVSFVDGEARHAVIVPIAGGVKITYDPVVSGKVCLYDWTFDNGVDKGDNRLASVGMNTDALTWDANYSAANGFVTDEAFTYGTALKTQSTPYSSFTVDYPTEWTCMVAGILPDVENGALITFGTKDGGLIGLIAGGTENEVKIVRTTGNARYAALATMTVPNARTTSHCYAFVKTEDKIVVYLDGVKWNETAVSGANFGASLQIGSVHGQPGSTGIVQVKTAANATAIQAVRIFEGVLGPKSLRRLAEEFPYLSENGTFTRTFSSTSENWVSDESWAKVGSGDKFAEPDDGAELKITAAANTTVKMNFDIANAVYENVSVNGSGSLTFYAGDEGYFAVNIGKTDVNVPITVEYGSLTIAAGPTTIGSSGSITFDYSAYPVATIHSEGFIQLTGQIAEQSPGKIKLVKPAALLERRMDLVYRDEVYGIEYGFDRDPIDLYFKNPTDSLALTNETELVDIDGNVKSRVMKDDALVIANNASFTIATNALDVQLSTLKITNATVTVNIPAANLNGLARIIVEDGGTLKFDSATAADYTGAIVVNEGGVFDVNGIHDLLMEVTLNGGTMTNSGVNVGVGIKQFPTMNFTADSVIDVAHDFGSIALGYGAHTVNLDGNVVEKRGAGNYYLANATIGGGGEFRVAEGTLAISRGLAIPADTEFKLTIDSAATVTFANTVTKNGVFNLEVGGALSAPITLAIDELTVNEGAIVAITSTAAITAASAVQNGSFTLDLSQLQLGEARKQLLVAPSLDISRIDFTVDASIEKRLYRLVYIDNILYVEPNNLTIAIPSVEHADVSVLVDGEPVEVVDEAITIIRGSDVFVNYVADPGWLFQDNEDHCRSQYSIELSDVQEAPNPSIAELLSSYIPLVEAKVSIDDVYYLDIGDALDAVHFNEEIRLWTAVALGGGYDVPCDMAINLNGFEMSAEEVLSFVIDGGYSLYLYDGLSHMFGELAGGSLNNIRFTLSEGTIYSYLNLDYLVDSDRYVRIYSSKVGYTYVAAESVPDLVSQFKPGETETIYLPCDSEATLIPLVEKVESLGYALFATGNENEFSVAISPDAAVNGSWIASFEIANGSATIKIPKAKANFYYGLEYADNPAFEKSTKTWAEKGATELSADAQGANMFYRVLITDKDPTIK